MRLQDGPNPARGSMESNTIHATPLILQSVYLPSIREDSPWAKSMFLLRANLVGLTAKIQKLSDVGVFH